MLKDALQNAQSKNDISETMQEYYQTLDPREQSRIQSTIKGAVELGALLDKDDIKGAYQYLLDRKAMLQEQASRGLPVDTQETDAAIMMLENGAIDELKANVQSLILMGAVLGG